MDHNTNARVPEESKAYFTTMLKIIETMVNRRMVAVR